MALDRFVRWTAERPALSDVLEVLEDYLGTACVKIEVDGPRLTALLVGRPRSPFRRVPGYEARVATQEQHEERWLEVYVDQTYVDVITRQADEYTNVVAEGFAQLCARFWNGHREPG